MSFRRSSFCSTDHMTEQCVEVELCWGPDEVGVSDSKDPDGPTLVFSHEEWDATVGGWRAGLPSHALSVTPRRPGGGS